ncbi:hypothetical protein D8674_034374 [Pyrus ussuriensis x Pyrus communis]|uniref:BURP domain-containing protein n=1 Tax=Pyrus ussuriensis x Pyrus communis TaxID=2448454 RepID=A0A5N5HNU2_9ROSA|nr:hypothetical protein D8674_034374 [Pyrus ussuriensis x Pyrus communis]
MAMASYATTLLPPQLHYWNSILPDTTMPKALSQLVQPGKSGGPSQVFFFLEKDMHPGNGKKYRLAKNSTRATFLSRKTAESIPFSSSKMPQILHQYSLKPGSVEAIRINETIQECEGQGIKGEKKQCATSLESMIDYAAFKLGRNIEAVSTEVEKAAADVQNFTISPGMKNLSAAYKNKVIVCHKLNYPYAVFYCHAFQSIRAYMVPLRGSDGITVKAVAICHTDI